MITRNFEQLEPFHNKNGVEGRRLYDNTEGQIIHMTVQAGSNLPAHITPVNVVFYVLEGELTIVIGDEEKLCPAGTLAESPKGIPHALYNRTDLVARLLVMKLPKPEK